MKQLILIGGGEVFDSKEDYYRFLRETSYDPYKKSKGSRKDRIVQACSWKYECFQLPRPCKRNSEYIARKIQLEKMFPYLSGESVVLIGNSLGATFWVKYLSENIFPSKIEQLHLCCPMFNGKCLYPSYAGIGDFDIDEEILSNLVSQVENIHIYHSTDDSCVPYEQGVRLSTMLLGSTLHTFTDRNHFLQLAFPELLEQIGVYKRDREV